MAPLRLRRRTLFTRRELALIAVTMVWGTTFLIVHAAMMVSGPFFFVGTRFGIAAVVGIIVFARSLVRLTRYELLAGLSIGVAIYFTYNLQTIGLQTISSSQSAFITALYVPFVPLLQWLVLRRPPGVFSMLGIGMAFTGLILLSGPDAKGIQFSIGEVLTIGSAIACAVEIILISRFAGGVNVGRVTVVQLGVTSLLSFASMPIAGESIPGFSWVWLGGAVALGAASIVIQLTMNWAQKEVSPTRATLIYASEPVWAGIFGRIAGDVLSPFAILGAGLIVAGVIVSELRFGVTKTRSELIEGERS